VTLIELGIVRAVEVVVCPHCGSKDTMLDNPFWFNAVPLTARLPHMPPII
jgi:hypothetical protein